MDAAGIDFQILSLFDPGVQDETDVARAIDLARRANDELAETVRANPNRFGGFATLATQDPDAAAAELERAVTELGLVGGLINGHSQGRYLDDPAYEGLFARAEAMGAPIYLHPTTPHPAVMEAWFAPVCRRRAAPRVLGVRRRGGNARVAADLLGVVRQVSRGCR